MIQQSSHSSADHGLDAYFTPPEAIDSLISIERSRIPRTLWEPACGNGAIVRPLRAAGYTVFASDIVEYDGFKCDLHDYLQVQLNPVPGGIITNPPFKLAQRFAEKALGEVEYLALLLRTNFLESQERLGFFRKSPPSRIWISSRRLPMMHRHGWTGPEAGSNTCHAWFVWDSTERKREINWFDWKENSKVRVIEKSIDELGL